MRDFLSDLLSSLNTPLSEEDRKSLDEQNREVNVTTVLGRFREALDRANIALGRPAKYGKVLPFKKPEK